MKKLIAILIISLACFTAFAQDGLNQTPEYYQRIKSELIGIDVDKVVQFAIDVTEGLEEQYVYHRRSITDRRLTVIYTPVGNDENDNLNLTFSVNVESENEDKFAEKANVAKITGSKETLIAIWINFFVKGINHKQVESESRYRILRDEISFLNPTGTGLHYRLVFKGESAVIENRSR